MQLLTLGVTSNCNLACKYCEQSHKPCMMSMDIAKRGIDLFASICHDKTVQISFYGGEPLIAESLIREAVLYADEVIGNGLGIRVIYEMTTNGLLLTEDFIEFAQTHNLLIALSHDGLTHDFTRSDLRGNPTRLQVEEKLKLLNSHSLRTPIMLTVHPDYITGLADSIEYLYSLGVHKVNITPANGRRVVWNDESFELLSRELHLVSNLYIRHNQGSERFIVNPLENKIVNYIRSARDVNRLCRLCEDKILLNCDGKFYPCTHFIGREVFCVGDLQNGLDLNRLSQFEAERSAPKDCDSCSLRTRCSHSCACANHGYNGSLSEPGDFQCEFQKLVIQLADEAAAQLIVKGNEQYINDIYKFS